MGYAVALVDQLFITATVSGILLIAWRYRHDPHARRVQLVFFGVLVVLCGVALLLRI